VGLGADGWGHGWSGGGFSFFAAEELEPVAVEGGGGGLPGVLDGGGDGGLRKIGERCFAAVGDGFDAELFEELGGWGVEIAMRLRGVGFAFLAQETLDISAIFFQQRSGAVFGMALEMDEEALVALPHEQVHAGR